MESMTRTLSSVNSVRSGLLCHHDYNNCHDLGPDHNLINNVYTGRLMGSTGSGRRRRGGSSLRKTSRRSVTASTSSSSSSTSRSRKSS